MLQKHLKPIRENYIKLVLCFSLYLGKERAKRQCANSCYYIRVPKITPLKKKNLFIYLFLCANVGARTMDKLFLFFTTLHCISWSNLISYILKARTGKKTGWNVDKKYIDFHIKLMLTRRNI